MLLFSLSKLVSKFGNLTVQASHLFCLNIHLFIELGNLKVLKVDSIFDLLFHLIYLLSLECAERLLHLGLLVL